MENQVNVEVLACRTRSIYIGKDKLFLIKQTPVVGLYSPAQVKEGRMFQ